MADWTARRLETGDGDALRALWDASPRHLLHDPAFARTVAGDGAETIAVFRSGELVAAFPFVRFVRRGFTFLNPLWFASFGGPLALDELWRADAPRAERNWRDALEALADARPADVDRVELIAAPGLMDLRALDAAGWTTRMHYNYVSRWESAGAWRDHMESQARRQEKKAAKAGLAADVIPAGESDQLCDLWRRNAGAKGLDAELDGPLGRLAAWLQETDRGFAVVVRDGDGVAHAAGLYGFDAHRVYYLAGASDPDQRGSGAPTLAQVAAHETIDARGLPRCLDWVGANTPGVVRFKRQFQPELEVLAAARWEGRKLRAAMLAKDLLRPQ